MHATSELREWFLEWLDGDNGQFDDEAIAKLSELLSCTDELPAAYCQHGRLHVPFVTSYGVAAQKILGNKDGREMEIRAGEPPCRTTNFGRLQRCG
jgi:hypothetical protein